MYKKTELVKEFFSFKKQPKIRKNYSGLYNTVVACRGRVVGSLWGFPWESLWLILLKIFRTINTSIVDCLMIKLDKNKIKTSQSLITNILCSSRLKSFIFLLRYLETILEIYSNYLPNHLSQATRPLASLNFLRLWFYMLFFYLSFFYFDGNWIMAWTKRAIV